jgi:predicted phage tail protein
MSEIQKSILEKYVSSISDTKSLVKYLNERIQEVTNKLTDLKKSTTDKVLKIKLQEIVKLIKPLEENKSIKDESIVGILQCYDLISEIENTQK